ncbi:fungal protein [Schizosaccharomyces japonicus yFS275]|uniref:Fungal protein n=1 Tax=Schizosaccharomyces japonicus (strain yFS275 / FY16936) TaxID=402676 RepID=B6JYW7_SCHJY|nr:fungal protein [Schizosaccharomyces japonicus yFS275]EEB06735.1 fungal protein [Schizosaccharomyces japonicus yFS275]
MVYHYKNNSSNHHNQNFYKYQLADFQASFDKARTFDAEDDLAFCPSLTEDEIRTIYQSTNVSPVSSSPSMSPSTPHVYLKGNLGLQYMNYNYQKGSGTHFNNNNVTSGVVRPRKNAGIPIVDPVTGNPTIVPNTVSNKQQLW